MLDSVLLILVVVVPAIVLHELAHGLVAWLFGDPTAKDEGRLTLNPISHIDLVGTIIIPLCFFLAHYFGFMKSMMLFGWAKPVPVNFARLRFPRLGIMAVAAAGPITNILLAAVFVALYKAPFGPQASYIFGLGVLFNLMLAVFNLIPIPPLDGSRIIMSVLPKPWARKYASLERYGLFIVVILLQAGIMPHLYPVISWLGNLLGIQL